ncbi:MAG: efflux RND transporter periplasmic adaptor subunit [Bacillota bacterium]
MAEGNKRRWVKPAVIISVIVLLVVLIVVRAGSKKDKNVTTEERLQPVEVATVVSRPFGEELSVAGTVSPFAEATVSPKISGRVVAVHATIGQRVSQGQALLTVDQTDYQVALRTAEANLSSARANSIQAETSYENAKINYQRTEELFNQGAVAKAQLEAAELQLATAETGYRANLAQIQQCDAALDKARTDYDNTVVASPFSGVVAQRTADVGEMVSPQTPVFTVIQDKPLLVKVNLSESTVMQVTLNQKVDILVAATGKTYQGTVSAVAPQADQNTKAFAAEITLDNPGEEVKSGMVADLRLTTRKVDNALVVPTDALLEKDNGSAIFVVEGDIAKERKVTTGMVGQGYTQVASGLNEGELVVVKGNHLLVDGMKVQVKETKSEKPVPTGGESN